MSSDLPAGENLIQVRGVGKWFPARLTRGRLLRMLWPTPLAAQADDFWALRDISLDLPRGRVLGLVGRNGSGKSTLLQIIAGLMAPSTGEVQRRGTVTPLLELGAGFNPEFTGRENILLSGQIYGQSSDQLAERMEAICEFAAIGEYIDHPVKTYSSGMFARLAFAVAIETKPDLLIVDEILAVGDVGFQARCHERIEDMREQGVSILYVSHDLNAMQTLCDEAILLEKGHMLAHGEPRKVIDVYLQRLTMAGREKGPGAEPAPRGGAFAVESSELVDPAGQPVQTLRVGQRYTARATVRYLRAVESPIYSMHLRTLLGLAIYDQNTMFTGQRTKPVQAGDRVTFAFTFQLHLCPGSFRLGLGVADLVEGVAHPVGGVPTIAFDAVSDKPAYGLANLQAEIQVDHV